MEKGPPLPRLHLVSMLNAALEVELDKSRLPSPASISAGPCVGPCPVASDGSACTSRVPMSASGSSSTLAASRKTPWGVGWLARIQAAIVSVLGSAFLPPQMHRLAGRRQATQMALEGRKRLPHALQVVGLVCPVCGSSPNVASSVRAPQEVH